MSIKDIILRTKCPFAKVAKLERVVISSLDINRDIREVRDIIYNFFTKKAKLDFDALVFIIEDQEFGNTIENLSINTKKFYQALALEFSELIIPQKIDDYNEVSWPSIAMERFFNISFAPCYGKNSPRYNHEDSNTYLFLQPVTSFERYAHDESHITDEFREKIRQLFKKNGQPYDANISCLKNEWVKLVHPLNIGDDIIKWWKK